MIFSLLITPVVFQEAEPASDSTLVPLEELDAGSDLEGASDQERCPFHLQQSLQWLLLWSPSWLTELPSCLSEESSLEPALVPAREKELFLENAPGPILDLIIIQSTLLFPQEIVLPPLFDLLSFIFFNCYVFLFSRV